MLRNRSDQLGKNILQDLLALGGEPRTEQEVPPGDAQRIDVWFVPDEARRHVLTAMKGVIAKIAESAAMIELWSQPLRGRAFHKCMRKLYDWHHMLELRDKLAKYVALELGPTNGIPMEKLCLYLRFRMLVPPP